ncbi:MAG: cytochrome c oxidase subunit [Blastocatellia bacterium]
MGKALALMLLILTAAAIWMIACQRALWFPENISTDGALIDAQFRRTFVVVGLAFIGAQLALGYAVWRFSRSSARRAAYLQGSNKLEAAWTLFTAVVFITLAIMGQRVWSRLQLTSAAYAPAQVDSVRVNLIAQQFQFTFHYAGVDGAFGKTAPEFYNDALANTVGLDPTDAAGKDDLQLPALVVPVSRDIELTMRSRDVIHNFFVPAMRIKQDIVPGLVIRLHFTANKLGTYEIPCAELCGNGHYKMKSWLIVVPADDYATMERMSKAQFRARVEELLKPQ